MGLFLGYTRAAAARYSFLLAVPAVLGSGFFQAYEALTGDVAGESVSWGPTILATVIAFGVGLTRDRLAAALPGPGQLHAVRRLPDRAGPAGPGAGRDRRPRPDLSRGSRPLRFAAVTTVLLLRHGRTTANTGGVLAGWTPGVQLDETGAAQVARGGGAAGEGAARGRREQPAGAVRADRRRRGRRAGTSRCRPTTGWARPATATGPAGRSRSWSRSRCGRSCSSTRRPPSSPDPRGRGSRRPRPGRWPPSGSGTPSSAPDAVWLACSHGDVIKAILADALGLHLDQFQRIVVDPASISVVTYTETRPVRRPRQRHRRRRLRADPAAPQAPSPQGLVRRRRRRRRGRDRLNWPL